jgi:mannosylglycerate hydrolase
MNTTLSNIPRQVDVVVHTHWDREWYLTREATLARAAAVMQAVLAQLESGALASFLFDGQTAAFEDLLAVAEPALAQRLRTQAAAGRIVLGPWYVMADEFLVSGESLLRNLEVGLADAASQGGAAQGQRLGYLPDSFGHVGQMPQILRQFGITSAVLWRGADAPHNRFDWVAPNGQAVHTVFLPEGYYQHPLNLPQWREPLLALLGKLAARTPSGPLLLTQGGDHLMPAPQVAARMAEFNSSQHEWRLRVTSLAAHAEAVSTLPSLPAPSLAITGELRSNAQAFVLPDVLSTRRYLKLAHQTLEDRLLAETEPLLARLWPADTPRPDGALQRAWRALLQQQAHDSICGCSLDAVHEEMQQRFVQLHQQLDALRQQVLAAAGAITLTQHSGGDVWADDSRCMLFNPLPLRRTGWLTSHLFLKGESPHAGLQVTGPTGELLPCELLACEPADELVSPLDDFPERLRGHRYEIAIEADLRGLSTLAVQVQAGAATAPQPITEINGGSWHVAVAANGSLMLTDKRGGTTVDTALSVLTELDAGDSYNFSPPTQAHAVHRTRWQLVRGTRYGAVQELVLHLQTEVPASLSADRQGRSAASVLNTGTLRLRVCGDEPHLCAQLHWHNQAQDQRTRLLLPFAPEQGNSTHSDTAFDWTARAVRVAQIPDAPTRQEMPVVVMPSYSALAAGPWAVAHRAINEFEVMQYGGQRWLGLTLVRSVGWLSRRDLRTRGVGAGPDIATPGAQCVGKHTFDFWLCAAAAGEDSAAGTTRALQAAAWLRRAPLLLRGHVPPPAPLETGNPVVQTSAVRWADGALELRLWNPTHHTQPLALDATSWRIVRADGTPADGSATHLAPHSMLTLRAVA